MCQVKKSLGFYFCRENVQCLQSQFKLCFQQIHKHKQHLTCLTPSFWHFLWIFSQISRREPAQSLNSYHLSHAPHLVHKEFLESWFRAERECPDVTLVQKSLRELQQFGSLTFSQIPSSLVLQEPYCKMWNSHCK